MTSSTLFICVFSPRIYDSVVVVARDAEGIQISPHLLSHLDRCVWVFFSLGSSGDARNCQ